jgi:hypothetical protein
VRSARPKPAAVLVAPLKRKSGTTLRHRGAGRDALISIGYHFASLEYPLFLFGCFSTPPYTDPFAIIFPDKQRCCKGVIFFVSTA